MDTNIRFEEAIERLENTVRSLEEGTLSLDESIAKYEEAIGLVRICRERLNECEIKVRLLTEGACGTVTDVPFNVKNED